MEEDIIGQGRSLVASWSDSARQQASDYLDRSRHLDDLYTELGTVTVGPGAMMDDMFEAGRVIYRNATDRARGRVCADDRLRAFADAENVQAADGLAVLAIVAAVVQPMLGAGINATLIAAIMLRIGLRSVCRDIW